MASRKKGTKKETFKKISQVCRSDSQTEGLIYFNSLDCLEVDLKAECLIISANQQGHLLACLINTMVTFSTATTRTLLRFARAKISPPRTVGVGTGQHLRHVSNNTPNITEQRCVSVAKRYAPHHQHRFDLAPPVDLQPILMESQMILHHLQQQHASFLHQNALTSLQIHRDGTFALSSRNRGWKIW